MMTYRIFRETLDAICEMAIPRACGDAHLARVGELDRVAHEIQQHLCEALFIAEANGKRFVRGHRERELLVLGERLGGGRPAIGDQLRVSSCRKWSQGD
jgi:hypothetical protein